jgi:hypothetical protein
MKLKNLLITSALVLIAVSCTTLEDANPAELSSFIKLYEGPLSIEATSMEITESGFVLLGNMSITDDSVVLALVRTDFQGNQLVPINYYSGGSGKSIKQLNSNNPFRGYVIIGDSIKINPSAEDAANIEIASARILILNENFNEVRSISIKDVSNSLIKDDYFGGAVTVAEDGKIYILGTTKRGLQNQQVLPERPFLLGFDKNLEISWYKQYESLDDDYRNSRSIHFYNGNILWATALADVQGGFISSSVAIPYIRENSESINFSSTAQTSEQLFLPNDIQPANTPENGFGVAGTYSKATDGSQGNVFFMRVRADGNIVDGSIRYFDAKLSEENVNVDEQQTQTVDTGDAIISTNDGGYVIAGTMRTIPGIKGNGERDVYLIKVDALGNIIWNKTIGGVGDETVCSVTETADGSILICGTHTLGGYAAMFLMKTGKNGELTK